MSNETRNKLTIYAKLCRNVTIFYRQELLYFKCRKNGELAGIQNEVFRVAVSLRVTAI